MAQLLVNKKVNKRNKIPDSLPEDSNIVDTVPKGHMFFGTLVNNQPLPPSPLDKWYVDASGFYYWAGALTEVQQTEALIKPTQPAGQLSLSQIKYATGATVSNAEKFLPYIIETCTTYNISSSIRQLCFLAQLGHESMGLFYTEELASGSAYENRASLGNNQPGDGILFKGRGLIQITGRSNYKALSADLGVDFIANPSLLGGKNISKCSPEQLKYAALSAGWFWNSRNLNALADMVDLDNIIDNGNNLIQFKAITKKINGGFNGLADRIARYKSGINFFK